MKNRCRPSTRFWLLCAMCVVAIGGFGCCNCKDCPDPEPGLEAADHWVVIHDKVNASGGPPWENCESVPATDNVGYLPNCLDVEKGDTIGFINYSQTDVKITHGDSLDAPTPIVLPKGAAEIFTVLVEGDRVLIDISSTHGHGGPSMIIRP